MFDSYWFARYPRPRECGVDNGLHFKKYFSELIDNYGLKQKVSLDYNLQSNGVIERIHQVLGKVLCSFKLKEQELDLTNPWDKFLSAAANAIRSSHHTRLQLN